MAIQQKLHTKLVQKLILTPSLQQAIKLLPMSTLELADLLNQEMVENPLLEEVPTEELQPAEQQQQQEKPPDQQPGAKRPTPGTTPTTSTSSATIWTTATGPARRPRSRNCRRSRTRSRPPRRSPTTCSGSSRCRPTTSGSREIGGAIIGNLDDDGYLVASVEEIAAMGEWPVADVERALQHVQTFDPIGVAARDLQECLWLQIRHLGLEGTPTEKIVTEHLRLLQNHQVPEIARKLGHADRRSQGTHRDHPQPRSEAGQPLQPVAVAVRHPRRLRRQGRGPVRRGAERGRPAAAAHQPGLPPAARQEAPAASRTTRRAPT